MRRIAPILAAALVWLTLAMPALAAAPLILSFDDDVAESEWWSGLCGFEIDARSSGHAIFHNDKRGATTNLSNWNINVWLTTDSGSYHLVDAGPDAQQRRAGTWYDTVTGRSLTYSLVIGRTIEAVETGEVVFHGRLVGPEPFYIGWHEPICDALD